MVNLAVSRSSMDQVAIYFPRIAAAAVLCARTCFLYLFASRVSSERRSHTGAVKWRLYRRSRELIATGKEWKRT
jgi:hypothetical protein